MADDKNPFNPPKLKSPTENATVVREDGYGFEYDDSSGQSQIKDLSYNTKVTIARYMSGLTKGKPTLRQSIDGTPASPTHPNRFPISYPDATYNAQSAQFDPATGYPLPVETTTNSDAFMPQNSLDPRSKNFETKTANYTQTISDTGGTKIWDGGDRNPIKTVLDGNKVLGSTNIRASTDFAQRADEPTKNADRFVGVYQSKVLSTNRFTGGVSITDGNVVQQEKVAAERIVQSSTPSGFSTPNVVKPGKLQKPYVGPTSSDEVFSDSNRVDLGQLAMVGHTLVARAAGILNANNEGYDPTSLKAPFEAAVPNKSQFGIAKYNRELFDVYNVVNSLPKDPSGELISAAKDPNSNNPDGGGGSAQARDPLPGYSTHDSYGAFYSSLYPFSQGSPAETVANVILVAISQLVELAFLAISEQINSGKSANISSKTEKKTYTLGSYLYVDRGDKTSRGIELFLGIKPVRRTTFGRALSAGIVAFLGGDIVKTGKGSYEVNVMSLLSKALVENQQFKIIALRSIIRSVTELVAKLAGLTPVGAVMLVSNAVLLEIKNSKIVTLLNTFSQLGDAVYGIPFQGEQIVINSIGDKVVQNVFAPSINPGDPASNYTSSNRLKTSVSNVTAHLLPPVGVDKFSNVSTGKFTIANDKDKQNPFKLERKTAEDLEKELSSEYVPFYIRDMRTNEVIGFHAFLKTLTDNYTPGYDSQEFYGRGEPIHLYKGSTNREISVTFMMAAMGETDFKVMWMKINKLITLVYPQYTQGRQIELDGNKMIQPFSQIIGSSPMVRLRIGDVIQSNYSDVSLRNLFGESTSKFQVNQKQEIELYKQFFSENNLTNPPTSNVAADWQKRIDEIDANDQKKNSKVGKKSKDKEKPEFNPTFYLNAADTADYITAKTILAASDNKNEEAAAKIKELTDKAKRSPSGRSDPAVTWYDSSTTNTVDNSSTTNAADNSPPQKTYSEKFKDFKSKQPVSYPDFFGENNNTIVKSFKENGAGGGLAGFIGSLQFNWLQEGHTWETNNLNANLAGVSELGVAPKIVEIQMSFKPVHDIAPGLNSDGYNRAPVYPLKFMKDRLK